MCSILHDIVRRPPPDVHVEPSSNKLQYASLTSAKYYKQGALTHS